jgi:LuxR family maltose regulon positive regulatory protein
MGNIHMMHGAFHRALEHCDAARALAVATGLEKAPAVAMAHQFRGYVLFEWNRLAEAEASLRRAWDVAGPSRGVRTGVARMMARVRTAVGDEVGAERWLDRLETIVAEPMTLRNREWLASVRVRQTLGPGHLRAVEEWLRTYDYRPATLAAFAPAELHARLHELDQVLALLEATEQWPSILDLAPRIVSVARAERCWFAARAASAEAVAIEASGRTEDADARFAHDLALGEEGSFVRVYTEGNGLRSRLLERAAQRGERAALRVLQEATPAPAATLTVAQHAVLERVASGASNKAIARGLGVSLSTVKTHLRAIFARLDVSSRTQAVAKAREIGILSK